MTAVLGVLLLASATFLFAWALSCYRRPVPPPWTTWETMSTGIVLLFIAMIAFGVGLLARFFFNLENEEFGSTHGVAILALLAALAVALHLLRAGARRQAPPSAAVAGQAAGIVPLAVDTGTGPGSGQPRGPSSAGGKGGGRRRKAA